MMNGSTVVGIKFTLLSSLVREVRLVGLSRSDSTLPSLP